jgi:hypothetical protein
MRAAEQLAKSGCFDGATAGQLLPRIIAARELDIGDATAACNIGCSRGKLTYTASLLSGLLARSEVYGYQVEEHTDERCVIHVTKLDKRIGTVGYTLKEAERAKLTTKDVWKSYPSDLLFARCLSRAIRRFCPDLTLGNAALTKEETGADTHEPIPAPAPPAAPPSAPSSAPAKQDAPLAERGVTTQQLYDLSCAKDLLEIDKKGWLKILAKRGVDTARALTEAQAAELIVRLKNLITARTLQEELDRKSAGAAAHRNGDLTVDTPVVGKGGEAAAGSAAKS